MAMDLSCKILKENFSSSLKHSNNYNPALLVTFAEHAAKIGNKDYAADCLQIYFGLNPPTNQFYIRAHLCEALVTAPINQTNQAGLVQALSSIVKAVNIAKKSECYHFLVYNASVLLWHICRPYQYPGVRHVFAKPLQCVVRALEECKEQDYEWRLQLLMELIHSQIDAGSREDAAQSCANAIQLAKKKIPSKLIDVLKIQVSCNLGEVKKDTEISSELSAIYQLYKTKGIIHQQNLTSFELEQKLRKVFTFICGGDESPALLSVHRDAQLTLLLELAVLSVEYCVPELAKEIVQAVCATKISHDPKLLLKRETLVCQLSLQSTDQAEEGYSRNSIENRLRNINKIANLLTVAKRAQHFDLVQYICVLLWNESFPLFQHNLRKQILNPLCDAASVLEEMDSVLLQLRANLHFEIAKIYVDQKHLQTGLKHLEKSITLDVLGEHNEQLMFLKKHINLRLQLYDIPDNSFDQATRLVMQASDLSSVEELRPLLIMAGELLVPTYFTNLLRKTMLPKNSLDKLKDYVQYKQQVEDSMTIIGNVKDRERCWILADIAKVARRHCVWDVASVAAQVCLYYDDGRWKVLKKQESRSNTLLSQQPSIQCSATSNPVINNNLDTSIAPESKSGDRDQNLISERKKVTKVIKLLAEIHCVLAECLINDLHRERTQCHSHEVDDPSIKETHSEWVSVVTSDTLKSYVRAAELSSSVGETWLVYNTIASLWNYSHQWLEVDAASTYRQLLPALKMTELRRDSALGVLVCTALSGGLVKKWMPGKTVSGKPESDLPTSDKKSGRQATKKGRDNTGFQNGEHLHIDPESGQDLKEALEVCEYAMAAYSEASLDVYQKLLVQWVRCKQLLQQPVPAKTFGISEGKDSFNRRAVVAVEMLILMGNGVWQFPNCPAPSDVVGLLTDCQWRDSLIEMSLWTKLSCIALKENDYALVQLCCDKVNKISPKVNVESQKQKSTLLLCLANSLKGQCLSATSTGNIATTRKSLEAYLNSSRFACNAGSYRLMIECCCHYWNACLPLAAISIERELLCEPMLELLTLTFSFFKRRKESVVKTGVNESSFEQDHKVLIAMYEVIFQAYTDKCDWKGGLQAVEDAMWLMPKSISRQLFKHKLIFKSRMGRNVDGDMIKVQDEPNHLVASLWYQAAKNCAEQSIGLRAYKNALQQSCNHSWQKVEYLVEFSEWLIHQQFPPQDAIDNLQKAVELLLSTDFGKEEVGQNIYKLEALMRLHVMMSLLYIKGSDSHKKLSLTALGFCLQMWKLTYLTMSGGVKSTGLTLPTTIEEWASFQLPEQLIDNTKTGSDFTSLNKCSIKKPMLSLHYLGLLVSSLTETGTDPLAIPVLQMQLLIARSLIAHSKPLCQLLYLRLVSLCKELGLISAAAVHSEMISNILHGLDPEDVARSRVEIEQHRAKKEAIIRAGSKHATNGSMQENHTNLIKDGVVLREIWLKQALVLLSQGEYQGAHKLLNQALESCQIFKDDETLFQVFSVLSVLALNEKDIQKFIDYFMAAQKLTHRLDHWLDGILLLTEYDTCKDHHHQISSVLEYAVSFVRSLERKLKNNTTVEYGSAVLTVRLNLFKQKTSLTCCSGILLTPLLHNSESVIEGANFLRKQGCCRDAAKALCKQANFYSVMAKQHYPLDLEQQHNYLLKALKLYETSTDLLYDIYDSARTLCQPSEDISLPIQRELIYAILASTDTLLMVFKEYSDATILAQVEFQKKSSAEKVIGEFVYEVPILSLIEEDWKATAMYAVEKVLGVLASAHVLARGNISLKAKCTYHVGHSFYLLARHKSPDWGIQWEEREIIVYGAQEKEITIETNADILRTDKTEESKGTCEIPEFKPLKDNFYDGAVKIQNESDKTKATERTLLQILSQSCHYLTETLYMVLISCDWNTGAFTALKIMDCCGMFDPVTSSTYLAFYQSSVTSTKLKELITKVQSDSSATHLGALLKQNDVLHEQNFQSALQANTTQLNTYEVYRRLQISENHLDLLKSFPANFRFIVLQHSLDRSQLFTAFLTPPQPSPPVSKKGQSLQQAEPLESVITTTKVSPKEFNYLQEMLENYYVSAMCLVETDSIEDRSNSDFAAVLSAMEQYFGDALKKVADLLSKESDDNGLSVVILSDSEILKLPLEAMAVFQQHRIASVSRDFSLQMLHHRILAFDNGDEEAATFTKDKKKIQVQPATLLADVTNFKYMLDPKTSCSESLHAINCLVNFISNNKVTSKWSGYSSPENKLSLNEWYALLKNASGLLVFGDKTMLDCFPATQLTTMNLQKCHVMLLTDSKQNTFNSQIPDSKNTLFDSKIESQFRETIPSMMLLSLAGASCIVTNQTVSSVISSSVIQDLLLEGNTIGGVYWTKTKSEPTYEVESMVLDSHEDHNSVPDTTPVTGDKHQCHNEKNSVATAYDSIVYGLPHISLV